MSEHGSTRPSADDIYESVRGDAATELERSTSGLGLSGLFAGFTIGATALGYSAALAYVQGDVALLIAALIYPIGYIAAIVGRAQLFTENTLYPVALVFEDRRRYLKGTARLWAIVLAGNVLGALLFALVAVQTEALPDPVLEKLVLHGDEAVARPFWTTFWAAVLAGWLLALVAWLVQATAQAIGTVALVWFLTMPVGLAKLDHSIATMIHGWATLFEGEAGLGAFAGWWSATLLGNVLGGVFIVTVLNYGQVHSGEEEHA